MNMVNSLRVASLGIPDKISSIDELSKLVKSPTERVPSGKKYLDPVTGKFQPPGITNISSSHYNEDLANRTHIPIKHPK